MAADPATSENLDVVIAGGGTGGHLFPGVAVAEEVKAQLPKSRVTFVGTERGIEARLVPELGYDLELIEVSGLKTVGALGALRGLLRLPRALLQSWRLLRRLNPDVVIGVGGYASGPVVMMARLQGRATAILEQNSIPGLTNRILGRMVDKIFLSFAMSAKYFSKRRAVLTGNPIRKQIVAALGAGTAAALPKPKPRLFVFGGSQGAAAVNRLVVAAAQLLKERAFDIDIVHQTGSRDHSTIAAAYHDAGIDADVRAGIGDMATEYQLADLIVSRAGATTVAELGIVGKPAILIPYPYAADNHQELNAAELQSSGAAKMIREKELTPQVLADLIADHLGNPALLSSMGSAMKAHGRPDAAKAVVRWCRARQR